MAYTDEPKYHDHATKTAPTAKLAADPSSTVCCKVEPLWIQLVGPTHPTDAQLN